MTGKAFLSASAAAMLSLGGPLFAADQTFSTAQTWSGTVNVDGNWTFGYNVPLTIEPGTTVNFLPGAKITLSSSGAFSANGTAAAPIAFTGAGGTITGNPTGMNLSHVNVSGMASSSTQWMNVNPRTNGLSLSNCSVVNSGSFRTQPANSVNNNVAITNCDLRDGSENRIFAWYNTVSMTNTKVQNSYFWNSTKGANYSGNIMVDGQLCFQSYPSETTSTKSANFVVENNYFHGTVAGKQYGIVNSPAVTVRDNVFRGYSWSTSNVGGVIQGNVFESFTAAERTQRGNDPTHENICGMLDNAVIERNIMLNGAYGSIMGIGANTLKNAVIRNNTIDMRGSSAPPVYLNHLPTNHASGIDIRNNLLMRTGRIFDEENYNNGGYADTIASVDYNAWGGTIMGSHTGTSGNKLCTDRFVGVQITGKSEGDDGFGMHDVMMTLGAGFDPKSVVADPDFVMPYTDAQMLAGLYTPGDVLNLYRQAYMPIAGSSVIDAGSPLDSADPLRHGSRIDIGAMEFVPEPGVLGLLGVATLGTLSRRRRA